MMKCPLNKIDDFQSLSEFHSFVHWIDEQVLAKTVRELPVKTPYAGATTLTEKWFFHVDSGEVWRLVWPDPPFTGVFELVM